MAMWICDGDDMRTAVYTGTRNVYGDMVTACKSLIKHRGADHVIFLIEDDKFPEPLPHMIQCVNVSGQTYFDHDGPNYGNRWTYMAMMRAAIPLMDIMPDRVLSLDIDTLVLGSLGELWELSPAPIYMAREVGRSYEYYNAGVMLIDKAMMRKDAAEIVRRINTRKFDFAEQDAINEVMRGRIKTLPAWFNVSDWTVPSPRDTVIQHYAAIRDWHDRLLWQSYAGLSWDDCL